MKQSFPLFGVILKEVAGSPDTFGGRTYEAYWNGQFFKLNVHPTEVAARGLEAALKDAVYELKAGKRGVKIDPPVAK